MTHEEILKAILVELHALNERENRSRDTLESMCIELTVSAIGSALSNMRCLKTLVAAGGDRHHLRRVIDGYLRKSIVADAGLMVDLERVPTREPQDEPFAVTLNGFIDQVSEGLRVRMAAAKAASEAPREIRVTPEEAGVGCVLPIRLGGKTVEVSIPAGVRDGEIFTTQVNEGHTIQLVISVAASRPTAKHTHANGGRPRTPKSSEMV